MKKNKQIFCCDMHGWLKHTTPKAHRSHHALVKKGFSLLIEKKVS